MALDATRLSTAIYNSWTGSAASGLGGPNGGALTSAQQAMLRAQCDAIAQAVVAEFTANAIVTVPSTAVTVASVSGVTTGPGVSGPGAGTTSATTGTIS